MLSSIGQILSDSPFIAVFAVFWAGALASLSSSSLVRIPIVFGLVAGTTGSRKKSILSLLSFVLGLVISYTILGILLGIYGNEISRLIPMTKYIYAVLGALIVIVGIFVSRILQFKSLRLRNNIIDKLEKAGYFVFFLFGVALALIDMPICSCPDHVSIIQVISGAVTAKGSSAYSALIFISFALGQSLLAFAIGILISIIKYITPGIAKFEGYICLVAGNILIVSGIYFILIA